MTRPSWLVLAAVGLGTLLVPGVGGYQATGAAPATAAPAAAAPAAAAPAAAALTGTVSGTVFQDFNGNGARDTAADATNPAVDGGVAGVTVTAFDASGNQVGQATSTASGAYTVNVTGAATDQLRLEVTGLPAGFASSAHGPNSATSVQFVAVGATGADVAVNRPEDYCQANPLLATSCYVFGDQVGGANAASPVVVSLPYSASGTNPPPEHPANASQVGTTFGLAYQRTSRTLFAAAFMKRHSGFGPGGPGAIYAIAPGNDGLAGTNDDVVGSAPFLTVSGAGTDPHPSGGSPDYFHDAASYDEVGKIGLGDLDVSADGATLYTVNLATRELVSIPIGDPPAAPSPGAVATVAVPTSGCAAAADARPFGLAVRAATVYVGVTCTAQSSGLPADLTALVYAYDGSTFSQVLQFPLTYARGVNPDGVDEAWNPWTATFPGPGPINAQQRSLAQPLLTDLVWDGDDLVLGVRDRMGDQGGVNVGSLNTADASTYYSIVYGDILRACASGGLLTPESGGNCGAVNHPADTGNSTGPGGGEFYWADRFNPAIANNASTNYHLDVTSGGLAQVPGFADVVTSSMDPLGVWSGGLRWLNRATGARSKGYTLYSASNPGSSTPNFGKANGIGEVEALCDAAPVEIGNRVWADTNRNGAQDPGEPGLANVSVSLYDGAGKVGPSVLTDAEGRWYFTVTHNRAYTVRLDNPADFAPGGPLAGLQLTSAHVGGGTPGTPGALRDSDAVSVAGTPTISLTAGGPGHNDHTFDVGLVPGGGGVLSLGNQVWADANDNNHRDPGEAPIPGVSLTLVDGAGNPLAHTTTDGNGRYLFAGLVAGTYRVCVDAANMVGDGPLAGYRLPTAAAHGPDDDADDDGNGVVGGAPPLPPGAVCSGPVTLAAGSEPVTDGDADANSNLTVDFGFVATAAIGNRVWEDSNGNGTQDSGEPGVGDVTVRLVGVDGAVVATTTTDANGFYLFAGLVPGRYRVCFVVAAGASLTAGNSGGDGLGPDALDSDADQVSGCTALLTVAAGQILRNVDAGVVGRGVLPATGSGLAGLVRAGLAVVGAGALALAARRRAHAR